MTERVQVLLPATEEAQQRTWGDEDGPQLCGVCLLVWIDCAVCHLCAVYCGECEERDGLRVCLAVDVTSSVARRVTTTMMISREGRDANTVTDDRQAERE